MKKPDLNSLPKKHPLEAPQGYFEHLSDRIITNATARSKSKSILASSPVKAVMAAAAALTIFLSVWLLAIRQTGHATDTIAGENTTIVPANTSLIELDEEYLEELVIQGDYTVLEIYHALEDAQEGTMPEVEESILNQEIDIRDLEIYF